MGNSELIFPESGLVVLEFDETATGGVAKFVGGNTKVQRVCDLELIALLCQSDVNVLYFISLVVLISSI